MISQIIFLSCVVLAHPIDTVSTFDLTKYLGRWYQVYVNEYDEFFRGESHCNTADYTIVSEQNISVLNSQYSTLDELEQITGYLYYSKRIDPYIEPGKLNVHLSSVYVDIDIPYWIYELGPEYDGMYEWSIVSDPEKLLLFVLTRDIDRFYENYNYDVLEILNIDGFGIPVEISHESCEYVKEPKNNNNSFKSNKFKYDKQPECQNTRYLRKS